MLRAGPKKMQRYSLEFKRTAVQLSQRPGMQVQVVAEALDIHPFMLSPWRKEFREGRLKPSRLTPAKPRASKRRWSESCACEFGASAGVRQHAEIARVVQASPQSGSNWRTFGHARSGGSS
jgi:transposase-like protein